VERPELIGEGLAPIRHGTTDRVAHPQVWQWLLHAGADDVDDPSVSTHLHAGHHRANDRLEADEMLGERREEGGGFRLVRWSG